MRRILSMLMLLVAPGLFAPGGALAAQPAPVISTSKMMYLLDPYYWVYSAAHFTWLGNNPGFWPAEGHAVRVDFAVDGYSGGSGGLTFAVEGLNEAVAGTLTEDPRRPGSYRGAFAVSEAAVGGAAFKPGEVDATGRDIVPKYLTLTVADGTGIIGERHVAVTRWGCDRCHLAREVAVTVYPWCAPPGGPLGPHYWGNVLGRNNGRPGFTYDNLTDKALTHTPTVGGYKTDPTTGEQVWVENPLNRPPYHLRTNVKQCGNPACSPCHQGYEGTPRAPTFIAGRDDNDFRGKSLTVHCLFCHGMAGGYVPRPARALWEKQLVDGWYHLVD
jgi:hypothetical protein